MNPPTPPSLLQQTRPHLRPVSTTLRHSPPHSATPLLNPASSPALSRPRQSRQQRTNPPSKPPSRHDKHNPDRVKEHAHHRHPDEEAQPLRHRPMETRRCDDDTSVPRPWRGGACGSSWGGGSGGRDVGGSAVVE
ncbi:hypothetical protein BDZ85DRAFT_259093 [Elsinoe ampelina]|uniref:Uncharacterized protein n=1 Tax=Elsinoe ampelina TaxID=302913 RepID=A0A6A6GH67_9PEZI|nr:hypothetical protein BDZ85DRAFT_259093 [Elsinoe ampelina]